MINTKLIDGIELLIPDNVFDISGCWTKDKVVWDKDLVLFVSNLLKNGDVFFDVGTNTGSFSFLNKNKNFNIHCFEPNTIVFNLLKETIEMNMFNGKHTLNNIALSNTQGTTELKIPLDGTGGSTISDQPLRFRDYTVETINTITLDEYFKNTKLNQIDVIKIDTEGHELFVLEGGFEVLKKYKPSIIMEHHPINMRQTNTNREEIFKLINDIGYSNIQQLTVEDLYVT